MANKKNLLVKLKKVEAKEVLEREATKFGNSAHLIIPQKHIDKKAIIIIEK